MVLGLLPGIRDLRTPLAVGATWLAVVWLLVSAHVPLTPEAAPTPLRPSYELLATLGTAAMFGLLGFVAYLIGVVMTSAAAPLVSRAIAKPWHQPTFVATYQRRDRLVVDAVLRGVVGPAADRQLPADEWWEGLLHAWRRYRTEDFDELERYTRSSSRPSIRAETDDVEAISRKGSRGWSSRSRGRHGCNGSSCCGPSIPTTTRRTSNSSRPSSRPA